LSQSPRKKKSEVEENCKKCHSEVGTWPSKHWTPLAEVISINLAKRKPLTVIISTLPKSTKKKSRGSKETKQQSWKLNFKLRAQIISILLKNVELNKSMKVKRLGFTKIIKTKKSFTAVSLEQKTPRNVLKNFNARIKK
jgi:hypothetical protein